MATLVMGADLPVSTSQSMLISSQAKSLPQTRNVI
jgi:hypothetical protein